MIGSRFHLVIGKTTILVVVLLSLPAGDAEAELGRLFYSPTERVLMNRARTAPTRLFTVNGVVCKNDRGHFTWINRDPVSDGIPNESWYRIENSDDPCQAMKFRLGADESTSLQPGETYDLVGRRIWDAYFTGPK